MPTVLSFGGLHVRIYTNDHPLAHVHVIGSEYEAKFQLNCPSGLVELVENFGFSLRKVKQIVAVLTGVLVQLCQEWGRIHDAG